MRDRRRSILHVDLDPFIVSVERSLDPSLRDRPLVIGGDQDGSGFVAAASEEARARGSAGRPDPVWGAAPLARRRLPPRQPRHLRTRWRGGDGRPARRQPACRAPLGRRGLRRPDARPARRPAPGPRRRDHPRRAAAPARARRLARARLLAPGRAYRVGRGPNPAVFSWSSRATSCPSSPLGPSPRSATCRPISRRPWSAPGSPRSATWPRPTTRSSRPRWARSRPPGCAPRSAGRARSRWRWPHPRPRSRRRPRSATVAPTSRPSSRSSTPWPGAPRGGSSRSTSSRGSSPSRCADPRRTPSGAGPSPRAWLARTRSPPAPRPSSRRCSSRRTACGRSRCG